MFAYIFLTFSLQLFLNKVETKRNCSNDKEIFSQLLKASKMGQLPNEVGTTVKVEIWVAKVTEIDELRSDFTLELYLNELWNDKTLNYEHMNPCSQNLSMHEEALRQIWIPNTAFVNAKYAKILNSPFTNTYVLIYPNGTVWTNYRMKVIGPCEIDFTTFPMDKLQCELKLISFTYTESEAKMMWNTIDAPVSTIKNKSVKLPDFTLTHIVTSQYTDVGHTSWPAGTWNTLQVVLHFQRRYGYYIIQFYIPTSLIVLISWISFCLGPKLIPPRTMICFNALTALIFLFGSIIKKLPKVSYIKALDVWILTLFCFVTASILELAIVAYILRVDDQKETDEVKGKKESKLLQFSSINSKNRTELAAKIDRFSVIFFPTCFAIFNLLYWGIYLSISEYEQ